MVVVSSSQEVEGEEELDDDQREERRNKRRGRHDLAAVLPCSIDADRSISNPLAAERKAARLAEKERKRKEAEEEEEHEQFDVKQGQVSQPSPPVLRLT